MLDVLRSVEAPYRALASIDDAHVSTLFQADAKVGDALARHRKASAFLSDIVSTVADALDPVRRAGSFVIEVGRDKAGAIVARAAPMPDI